MVVSTQPAAQLSLPLQWIDFDETPIRVSNHFLAQHQPNEFVLTFGQATGSPVVGTPEQMREQARDFSRVPSRTMARTDLTRGRVLELIELHQSTRREHDRVGPSS
jgi:hypothetical protein